MSSSAGQVWNFEIVINSIAAFIIINLYVHNFSFYSLLYDFMHDLLIQTNLFALAYMIFHPFRKIRWFCPKFKGVTKSDFKRKCIYWKQSILSTWKLWILFGYRHKWNQTKSIQCFFSPVRKLHWHKTSTDSRRWAHVALVFVSGLLDKNNWEHDLDIAFVKPKYFFLSYFFKSDWTYLICALAPFAWTKMNSSF